MLTGARDLHGGEILSVLASLETHTDRQLAAKEDDSIEKLIPSDFGQVVKQWIGDAAPSRK